MVQPGVRPCPLSRGASVLFSFYVGAEAAPLALADISLEGCGGVSLILGGVRQQALEGGADLVNLIAGILGVRASVGPPVGAVPHLSGVHISREHFGVEAQDNVTVGVESGTEFLFHLSAPAEVHVAISRLARGARYTQTCLANTQRRRLRANRCVRTVTVARLTRRTEPEGEDAISFSGKVDGRALKRGRYVAMLSARDTGGRSGVARVEFEITR